MTEHSIGEALIGLLADYGVDTIFGIPGVHNVEMYRALPRSAITHILTRHEQGAGFMADGYARATGKPGVCFTITGPGLTNILTPLGQAWSDSSNVLVISTALDVADSAQGRGRLHEMVNQFASASGITSNASRIYSGDDLQDAMARSFAGFASARPRPAYIEIPLDVLNRPVAESWTARALPLRPQADTELLHAAAEMLNAAKNPMLILGGGAMAAGVAALQIATKLACPILTTTAGKGTVPANHPLVWGYLLGQPEIQKMLQQSDCVLAVGSELSETDFWNGAFRLRDNLIRIDIDPASLARPHVAKLAILGDAAPSLTIIAAEVTDRSAKFEINRPQTPEDPLRQSLTKVLSVIRDSLPDETVIASDMTQIAYAANEVFPVNNPRTWLHPVGFGTLGFALPAAIGAKFGVGEKPVVALAGDYGLQYTINELATAVEHGLSLPILVWNNNALGQIRDDMVMKGIQPNAVSLRNPDFQMLANAYGAAAAKPSHLRELATAIELALKTAGPTLIEMTPAMVTG